MVVKTTSRIGCGNDTKERWANVASPEALAALLIEHNTLNLITVRSGESAFLAALHADHPWSARRVFVADDARDMADLLDRLAQDRA